MRDKEKRRAYNKAYAATHPEQKRADGRRFYAAHREEIKAYGAAHLERRKAYIKVYDKTHREQKRVARLRLRYDLTPEAFDSLLAGQGGFCAACGLADWNGHGPVVDHDHKTRTIRGILCHKCNTALGLMADDPAKVRALADYLERTTKENRYD